MSELYSVLVRVTFVFITSATQAAAAAADSAGHGNMYPRICVLCVCVCLYLDRPGAGPRPDLNSALMHKLISHLVAMVAAAMGKLLMQQ